MSDFNYRRLGVNRLYIDPEWRPLISYNKLEFFDVIWNMPIEPLDPPNQRRGLQSFSVAGVLEVRRPAGGQTRLVVKKQQNYRSRTLRHPVSGIPTFQREFSNALRFRQKGLPTFRPVLFARKSEGGYARAVLLSEYLEGYRPLSGLIESRRTRGEPDRKSFAEILVQTAKVVRRIHDSGFQHGCLYPKHIFIRQDGNGFAVRVIDLENSRYRPLGAGRIYRDLETLYRRGGSLAGRTAALRFVLAYLGERSDRKAVSNLFRRVEMRYERKLRARKDRTSPNSARDDRNINPISDGR